jgi:N6-L-threonylcarbamoyladenine synthase
MTKILGIETSCDETSVAVVEDGVNVLSNVVKTQIVHSKFGGVVPDLSSREHVNFILDVANESLKKANLKVGEIDAISVVNGPGLVGSLMVGVSFAEAICIRYDKKLITTDHIVGHIYGNVLTYKNIKLPMLSLVVSGGHTSIFYVGENFNVKLLGKTKDDAAGEAFDKCAKILNLGYPGGPVVEKVAKNGDENFYKFPVSKLEGYDFSFSGLKTSVLYYTQKMGEKFVNENINHIAASLQKAIVEQLLNVFDKCYNDYKDKIRSVSIAGGVSANSYFRERFKKLFENRIDEIYIPFFEFCTDNAALTAGLAYLKFIKKEFSDLGIKVFSRN